MKRNFRHLLKARWEKGFFVCIGLDTELLKIPGYKEKKETHGTSHIMTSFNKDIVTATHEYACAFKLNSAFYEERGTEGVIALRETIRFIQRTAPEVLVIVDAKRADIGNTNNSYANAIFDGLGADAVTVHPYLGAEAMIPFLERDDKGIIVLCRTSNKGAGEFQDLITEDGRKVYQVVAKSVYEKWNALGNCAIVVGATYPEELKEVRSLVGYLPILIPGIGAQGGDLEKTVKAGKNGDGEGIIINSSRGIIFASSREDYAEAARRETIKLHEDINRYRQ